MRITKWVEVETTAIEILMRVHYGFFMANPRFWYEKDLIDADCLIVVAASDLRKEDLVAKQSEARA